MIVTVLFLISIRPQSNGVHNSTMVQTPVSPGHQDLQPQTLRRKGCLTNPPPQKKQTNKKECASVMSQSYVICILQQDSCSCSSCSACSSCSSSYSCSFMLSFFYSHFSVLFAQLQPELFQALFPFELDPFQTQALRGLAGRNNVIVSAPTGSGKTVVGELAVYYALALNLR